MGKSQIRLLVVDALLGLLTGIAVGITVLWMTDTTTAVITFGIFSAGMFLIIAGLQGALWR